MYWTISANLTITKKDGTTMTWTSTRTRTLTAGADTKEVWSDDEYTIEGTGSGIASNGMSFDVNITNPLLRKMICRYMTAGTIEYIVNAKNTRTKTLDFGNGDCDNEAVLTVNGKTKTITLK
jgi:hypothetical protein